MSTKMHHYTLELGILSREFEDEALRELTIWLKHQGVLTYLATREETMVGRVVMYFARSELGKAALHGVIEAGLTDTNTRHALQYMGLVSIEPDATVIAARPIHEFFPSR